MGTASNSPLETLESIETKIIDLAHVDISNWSELARLIIKVKENDLYEKTCTSFSAWIKQLSQKAKIHESLLWRRYKAGVFYIRIQAAEQEKGHALPEMSQIKVSPDNLVLISEIVRNNDEEAAKLVSKVLDGNLTRKDLKAAKAAVRKQRELAGIPSPVNGYARDKIAKSINPMISAETGISAAKILLALQENRSWIPPSSQELQIRNNYKTIYHVLPEFPIDTGDTRHARRIDALVAENISSEYPREIVLRAIEIKVAKNDLLRDEKMSEYTTFCDYFYIAVPKSLESDAKSIMLPEWGLLVIYDEQIEVVIEAQKKPGTLRNEAMSTVVYEIL